jgi:hypothetical protein
MGNAVKAPLVIRGSSLVRSSLSLIDSILPSGTGKSVRCDLRTAF